jgi:hypothetical protein
MSRRRVARPDNPNHFGVFIVSGDNEEVLNVFCRPAGFDTIMPKTLAERLPPDHWAHTLEY